MRAFFSFYYFNDVFRASLVRQMGAIEGDQIVDDNSWEQVKKGGDPAIEKWIKTQMRNCDVVVVLVKQEGVRPAYLHYFEQDGVSLTPDPHSLSACLPARTAPDAPAPGPVRTPSRRQVLSDPCAPSRRGRWRRRENAMARAGSAVRRD